MARMTKFPIPATAVAVAVSMLAGACASTPAGTPAESAPGATAPVAVSSAPTPPGLAWTRGATCYEVFVRSFQDSDGDGIGDINGLIARLDYLNDGDPATQKDLGVRCIWLMPVAESPSYHGYDVTDYYKVEADYGTNADFKRLMAESHRRGIKVLVDMVLNHSSSEHPFFKEALRDPASPYRAWYRWSPRDPKTVGPWGQQVWAKSPARDEWYYAVFWSGMPDLNYEHPPVREEANKVARFWLEEMGVDGFRLDAIPYLVETGDKLKSTPATHQLLRDYQAFVRRVKPDAFTIGEVWDSTGAMLPYYPDQLDAHFAFDIADGILEAVSTGKAERVLPPALRLQAALPQYRYSPFLRNHDQPRTMTVLKGDARRARAAATLMLTMPGLPFLYYGEEIGMTGDKPDERIRTPMHWRATKGAGFTTGTPWERLQSDSLTATVEGQEADAQSLLNLHRRLVQLRASHDALAGGHLVPLTASDPAVTAYVRREGERAVLVVANLAERALTGVTLGSAAGALPAGRWQPRDLLGSAVTPAPITVEADGRIGGWTPFATLAPMTVHVLDVTSTRVN